MGSFSTLMKLGRQGLSQGKFAFTASVARIVLPILSEYLEQYIRIDTSFSICLVMIGASALFVVLLYAPLSKYTDRNPTTGGTPTGLPPVLGKENVRNVLTAFSAALVLAGCITLAEAAIDRRG